MIVAPPETPVVAQLSDVEDTTLWHFVTAVPDKGQGVYALRSKYAEGQYCLQNHCVLKFPDSRITGA